MKVSIITINYNNSDGLKQTINSVLSQKYENIEYIIIDGGSTDESKNVILENTKGIAHWVSENDRGIYHAMNKGIELSTGDYLLFLNSGDILYNEGIIFNIIPHLSADIVYGDLAKRFSDTELEVCTYPDKLSFSHLFHKYLPHPASFFKADILKKSGNYDEKYQIVADWVLFLRAIAKHNATYLHVSQIISIYDTGGISSKQENFEQILSEREHFLKEEFGVFYDDYIQLQDIKDKLASLRSSKSYKFLKFIGSKKFD